MVPVVASQHHEKQDGTGYPRGLHGDNTISRNRPGFIHDFGAVAAVADIYDAVSSDRPYRVSMAPDRVVKLIRGLAKTHLNRIFRSTPNAQEMVLYDFLTRTYDSLLARQKPSQHKGTQ